MRYFSLLLLFIVLGACKTKMNSQSDKDVSEIIYGKHFGHCRGICRNELIFTVSNTYHLSAGNDLTAFPESKTEIDHSETVWKELTTAINWKTFQASEDRIGCPDCADGGSEYIEIKTGNDSKRITFENGSTHEFLEPLLTKLRQLYDSKIR
jgi:hypothetical protein